MKVRELSVHVMPWMYDGHVMLRVQVNVRGLPDPVYITQIHREDDFESHFDSILKTAGEEIKAFIKKEKK